MTELRRTLPRSVAAIEGVRSASRLATRLGIGIMKTPPPVSAAGAVVPYWRSRLPSPCSRFLPRWGPSVRVGGPIVQSPNNAEPAPASGSSSPDVRAPRWGGPGCGMSGGVPLQNADDPARKFRSASCLPPRSRNRLISNRLLFRDTSLPT